MRTLFWFILIILLVVGYHEYNAQKSESPVIIDGPFITEVGKPEAFLVHDNTGRQTFMGPMTITYQIGFDDGSLPIVKTAMGQSKIALEHKWTRPSLYRISIDASYQGQQEHVTKYIYVTDLLIKARKFYNQNIA